MSNDFIFNGFLSKITKSANFPAVKVPFDFSSKYWIAAHSVNVFKPSYGLTLWSGPKIYPDLVTRFIVASNTRIEFGKVTGASWCEVVISPASMASRIGEI